MKAGDYCPVALRLPGLQSRRPGKAKPPPGSFPERFKSRLFKFGSSDWDRLSQ